MSQQSTLNIHKIERVDESFYFDKKSSYDLIFKFDRNLFQAVVYNVEREKFVLQAEFDIPGTEKQYKEILNHTDFLQRDFRNVVYISNSEIHSIVPDAFYDGDTAEKVLNFQSELAADHLIYNAPVSLISSRMIYAMQSVEVAAIRSKFPEVKFIHSSCALMNYVQHIGFSGSLMLINVNKDHIELVLMKNDQCELYNIYPFQTSEDMIYYPVYICEQLGITGDQLHVLLCGDVDDQSSFYEILKQYFVNISFAPRDQRFSYSYRIEDDPQPQKFVGLYPALSCV